MSDERAREIVQTVRQARLGVSDSTYNFDHSESKAVEIIASALSAARDEERKRVLSTVAEWLRREGHRAGWAPKRGVRYVLEQVATILEQDNLDALLDLDGESIAANQHRNPRT